MNENDLEKIDTMISRHVGAFADSIQHKLDLVVEGQQMLSEKIDRVETRLDKRMDCLEHKLIAVAAETNGNTLAISDLSAETKSNTLAIRDLSAETKSNALAIRDLSTETKSNTLAIRDLSIETKSNTLGIRDLSIETKSNTLGIRDLSIETKSNTLGIRDLSAKLDGVAADLSAHRRDTEAHPPVYRVKEEK